MREFNASMHSGDAPRDLRVHIPADTTPADDTYQQRLINRGDTDIAHMLYDPYTMQRPPSHRSRAQAEAQVAALQIIRDTMEVA